MQVWVPWVSAVFGASQYELLLAAFLENMAEPCSFKPKQAPPVPVGRRPPPVPPQPQVACPDRLLLYFPALLVSTCMQHATSLLVLEGGCEGPTPSAEAAMLRRCWAWTVQCRRCGRWR